jgi:hypothetical protein
MAELEAHRCDDAVSRNSLPEIADLRARMKESGSSAFNHAGTAIDQAMRMVLLSLACGLLGAGRFLVRWEREISEIHEAPRAIKQWRENAPRKLFGGHVWSRRVM